MRRVLLLLLLSTTLLAAEPERGKLVENVAARLDATQTYTLYLPARYDAAAKHPLLFVFDPRGRGTFAADLFKGAAEQHGWIVISSNQTRSDDDGSANTRAVRALLPELGRYASDPRRIYAAGFSGTAILSCAIGVKTNAFAGVIAVGGRLVDEVPPARYSFAHYGFAGDTDFNNREMRVIDAMLERAGKPHRFQQFVGPHQWIDAALAREAVDWLELMAMKEQRRTRDAAFINAAYERDVAAANVLETAGQRVDALRRDREIATTFAGLHAIDEITAAVSRLQADAAVQRELKDIAKWDDFELRYMNDVSAQVGATLARLRQEDVPPTAAVLLREFRIADLQRRAKREGAEGVTARRVLEAMYTQTSFYLTRDLMEKREYALAAAVLGVSITIHPDRWPAWYNLGAAQARSGDRRHALDSLEKAVAAGFKDRSQLLSDEDFASLRGEARFRALLASGSQ
jgi:predicted esterase